MCTLKIGLYYNGLNLSHEKTLYDFLKDTLRSVYFFSPENLSSPDFFFKFEPKRTGPVISLHTFLCVSTIVRNTCFVTFPRMPSRSSEFSIEVFFSSEFLTETICYPSGFKQILFERSCTSCHTIKKKYLSCVYS